VQSKFLLLGGGTSGCHPRWSMTSPYSLVLGLYRSTLLFLRHAACLASTEVLLLGTRKAVYQEKNGIPMLSGILHGGGTASGILIA
jgi:hypothetical protein